MNNILKKRGKNKYFEKKRNINTLKNKIMVKKRRENNMVVLSHESQIQVVSGRIMKVVNIYIRGNINTKTKKLIIMQRKRFLFSLINQ